MSEVRLTESEREALIEAIQNGEQDAWVEAIIEGRLAAVEALEIVHMCPPGDSGLMPCCGRTPFEVARSDRMTVDRSLVTCCASLVLAELPEECWVSRDTVIRCTDFIGFSNGRNWTRDMCCLPCRIRSALTTPPDSEDRP